MTEMRVLERVARNAPFGVSSSVRNASDEQRDAKRQRFRTIDWPVVKNLARYFCAKASDGRWVCALHTKSRKGDPFGPRRYFFRFATLNATAARISSLHAASSIASPW